MSLSWIVDSLFELSVDHTFDGVKYTKAQLLQRLKQLLPRNVKRVVVTRVNLPDGSWLCEIESAPDGGSGAWYYGYYIPETREEEERQERHLQRMGEMGFMVLPTLKAGDVQA